MLDRMTQIESGIAIDSLFKELADPPTRVNAKNGSHRMVDWARSRERRRCNPDYRRNPVLRSKTVPTTSSQRSGRGPFRFLPDSTEQVAEMGSPGRDP